MKKQALALVSPFKGGTASQQQEGAAAAVLDLRQPHPDPLRGSTLPSRGREAPARFAVVPESPADIPARDALLDRAMGRNWRRKASEQLRRGRAPAEGLALVAKDAAGTLVGTVRLWDVGFQRADARALLLGPLAVDPANKGAGIGGALMRHAVAEATRLGHRAILLVGDAPYYGRFGFSAEQTEILAMPGPYEKHRLLALELVDGALAGAGGVLMPTGRKMAADPPILAPAHGKKAAREAG